MATQKQYQAVDLAEKLFADSTGISLFQVVRLLDRLQAITDDDGDNRFVRATDHLVRFRGSVDSAFPASEVLEISRNGDRIDVVVSLFSLTGSTGALPEHYTQFILDRQREGDDTFHEFIDLFFHRLCRLFVDAWAKHHVPCQYERAALRNDGPDSFTDCLWSLLGIASESGRRRLAVAPETPLHLASYFSSMRRSAIDLQDLLTRYLNKPVSIVEFAGSWLYFDEEECSRLGSSDSSHFNVLGSSFILGTRVWSCQSQLRIRIQNLDVGQFQDLLPGGAKFVEVTELVRLHLGLQFGLQIEPVLEVGIQPEWLLSSVTPHLLGWNTWSRSGQAGLASPVVNVRDDM